MDETKQQASITVVLGADRAFVVAAPPSTEWQEYRFSLPIGEAVRLIFKLMEEPAWQR